MSILPQSRPPDRRRPAFTLVELLVTIAIIAVLIALIVPSVQAVRESARVSQCRNNLRQIAIGCTAHEVSHGFLPTPGRRGGSNGEYTGDPDVGFKGLQSGGWLYNILPYVEQSALWELGAGRPPDDATKKSDLVTRVRTGVAIYNCPGRPGPMVPTGRRFIIARVPGTNQRVNIGRVDTMARSDYASCRAAGGVGALDDGAVDGRLLSSIADGLGNVFLCGEKYLHPLKYNSGAGYNDGGWTAGNDWDTISQTSLSPVAVYEPSPPVVGNYLWYFGGRHGALNMAMCDGSVRAVNYDIHPSVFRSLGAVDDEAGSIEDLEN